MIRAAISAIVPRMIRETENTDRPTTRHARAATAMFVALLGASCSEPPLVEPGKQVSLIYEATDPDGNVLDVNPDDGPLVFIVGAGMVQPKVEAELIGMRAGEEKTFTIPDAYGAHNPKKTGTLTRKALAADVVPNVGDVIPMAGGLPATILEVNDRYLVLDLNHPLAGKELTFAVKVVEVKDPEPEPPPQQPQAPAQQPQAPAAAQQPEAPDQKQPEAPAAEQQPEAADEKQPEAPAPS